jgi:hypothetical protein
MTIDGRVRIHSAIETIEDVADFASSSQKFAARKFSNPAPGGLSNRSAATTISMRADFARRSPYADRIGSVARLARALEDNGSVA